MLLTNYFKSKRFKSKNLDPFIGFMLLVSIFVNYSCVDESSPISSNYNYSENSVKGSGNVVSETRDFDSFHTIHIATAGTVFLTQSDTQNVKVTIDDNLIEYIRFSVANNVLIIDVAPGYSLRNMHLSVQIKLPLLKELHTSSAGEFVSQSTLYCDELRIFTSSAGNVSLDLEANYLFTSLSSAGNVNLTGTASNHDVFISSAGSLHAFNFITDTTTIHLSSDGMGQVFVKKLLNATLSSLGLLYYKGNPVIHATVSSLGKIINAN